MHERFAFNGFKCMQCNEWSWIMTTSWNHSLYQCVFIRSSISLGNSKNWYCNFRHCYMRSLCSQCTSCFWRVLRTHCPPIWTTAPTVKWLQKRSRAHRRSQRRATQEQQLAMRQGLLRSGHQRRHQTRSLRRSRLLLCRLRGAPHSAIISTSGSSYSHLTHRVYANSFFKIWNILATPLFGI